MPHLPYRHWVTLACHVDLLTAIKKVIPRILEIYDNPTLKKGIFDDKSRVQWRLAFDPSQANAT